MTGAQAWRSERGPGAAQLGERGGRVATSLGVEGAADARYKDFRFVSDWDGEDKRIVAHELLVFCRGCAVHVLQIAGTSSTGTQTPAGTRTAAALAHTQAAEPA